MNRACWRRGICQCWHWIRELEGKDFAQERWMYDLEPQKLFRSSLAGAPSASRGFPCTGVKREVKWVCEGFDNASKSSWRFLELEVVIATTLQRGGRRNLASCWVKQKVCGFGEFGALQLRYSRLLAGCLGVWVFGLQHPRSRKLSFEKGPLFISFQRVLTSEFLFFCADSVGVRWPSAPRGREGEARWKMDRSATASCPFWASYTSKYHIRLAI